MTYVPPSMPPPSNAQILALMEQAHFASVISALNAVSHLPMDLRSTSGELDDLEIRFHLARANSHREVLLEKPDVLLIFRGPDGYISPTWYDHENVPTWDYAFVHVHGKVEPFQTDDELEKHVYSLINQLEPTLSVRREYADKYLPAIQGFRVRELEIEPVFKLSQNKSSASIQEVCFQLRTRDNWLDSELAALIEQAQSNS